MHAVTEYRAGVMGQQVRMSGSVIPRMMRRVRSLFLRGVRLALPRFIGSMLLSIFLSIVLIFGIVGGGHSEAAFKMLTSTFGLAVTKIDIEPVGQASLDYVSEIDILEAVELDGDAAMLTLDVHQAHERIVSLPFVQSAILHKIYPNRLHVAIKERQPIALWQHQGRLDVIDGEGAPIVAFEQGIGDGLPLLVGRGANHHGAQILAMTRKFEAFQSRIRAYRRVADRRWDIVLDNGIEIKLPEKDFEARLEQMLTLDEAQDLIERDVLSIDLRLDDRISVALSDEAMARWRDEVAAAERARKRQMQGRGQG